jgi:hypothetical protein
VGCGSVPDPESGDVWPNHRDLACGIDTHDVRKCLSDAEDAAADISIAVVDAYGRVADEDFADADRRCFCLLEAKPVEASIVPDHDRLHQRVTPDDRKRPRPDSW